MPEYEEWKDSIDITKFVVKYYKGLGTSTPAEAKEYFSELERHTINFIYEGAADDESILLAFGKKNADARKKWIEEFVEGTYLDQTVKEVTHKDFINKELILFSIADNVRSIPSAIDSLKTGQRKILFGACKRKLSKEIKVAQLAGYVSEHTGYHHGEISLTGTIVNMAQNFTGANNINLFYPSV
jgi:DNA topoisomerase-2